MFSHLVSFLYIIGVVTLGFTFGLVYLVGGDISHDTELNGNYDNDIDFDLSSFAGCLDYMIQTAIGQNEWSIWIDNPDFNLSHTRSRVVLTYLYVFSIITSVLILNMLIALMSNVYRTYFTDFIKMCKKKSNNRKFIFL